MSELPIAYDASAAYSAAIGEAQDCAVHAIALATGTHYRVVHAALEKHGRKHRRGTSVDTMRKALRELGWTIATSTSWTPRVSIQLAAKVAEPRAIALTRSHALAIRDGNVLDWTAERRHRVYAVWNLARV